MEQFTVDRVRVCVFADKSQLGEAAAADATRILGEALARQGSARIIIGTGNSQLEVMASLTAQPDVPWNTIEMFHMDEYVGLPADHPASFRRWLREHVADRVHPGKVHYVGGDASDADEECRRYASLLSEAPIDITFFGIGENGHIAFNEPQLADFADPALVKRITLDERSRRQQVGEGHYPSLDAVPREALTITCPVIARSRHLIGCVPDLRKAEAVSQTLTGPIAESCPASMVRRHPNAVLYLDSESASLVERKRHASS
ncbi:MAG: glucosamine-6-phosphate deaminase [Bryobacteraceae bacterium]